MTSRDSFIERMGLAAESDGLSRIAGRLFGALLLESEPRSLDDLADQLGVSKASVSTEARRLLDRGVAERVGKPGDRRDYYVLSPDFFAQIVRFRLNRWSTLHQLVRELPASAPDLPRVVRDRFAYIDDVHAFVLSRVESALAEWHEHNALRSTTPVHQQGRARQKRTPKSGVKRAMSKERID